MQRTNSEYGSPYLATHHFPFPFPFPYDYLQKSEKATMQDLNDRLASYLDKVHFLKAANATLEKQIREYCEKKGLICQRDYSCYFKTIDCLQEKVQNGRLVKITLL